MKRKIKILVAVPLLLGVFSILGADRLLQTAARGRTFSEVSSIPHRKVGLLLGCSRQLADGRNNLFFSYRTTAAAQLYHAHKIDYLLVSGDNHTAGYDESSDMKSTLINLGVPAERIYCDFAGFRTLDSIVRAKVIFGQTNITVISQKFHNQRAIYIASHKGIDAIGFNAQEVDSYNSFFTKFRELFARVKTVLDVSLLGTGPKFLGPEIAIGEKS